MKHMQNFRSQPSKNRLTSGVECELLEGELGRSAEDQSGTRKDKVDNIRRREAVFGSMEMGESCP